MRPPYVRYDGQTKNWDANKQAIGLLTLREKIDLFHSIFGYSYRNEEIQNFIESKLKELKPY